MNRTERRDRCRATAMSRRSPVVQAIAAAALLGLLSSTDANAAFSDETGARLPSSADMTYTLAVGDVDGGGDDLLVVNNGQLGLLVNDGNGVFSDVTLQLPSQSVAALGAVIADLDGDTDNDIFVANALGPNLLLINNGAGTFSDESAARLPGGSSTSVHVAVGDVDGDGDRDLVVANRNGQNQLLLNNGAGVFVDGTAGRLPVDNDPSQGVVLFDANGDGGLDLFVANQGAQDRILINNKVGVFTDETALRLAADPTTDSFKAVALDANGDGRLDLAIAGGGAGARLLLQDAGGAGTFSSAALPTASEFTIDIAAGDIDFDGSTDLFLANAGQDRVLLNDGTGTFTDDTVGQLPVDTDRTFGVALFDFDGDFDLDLVLARHMDGNTGGGAPNLALRNVIAAPRVLVAVAPDYIEQTDSFSVVAQVADDGPFDAPVLQVVGPNAGDLAATSGVVPCAEGPPLTWTCPSSALTLPFGSYTATVDVQDQEVPANIGQRVVNFVVVEEDLEPPSIDVFTATPQATPLVIGQTISVQVEASDPPLVSGADGSGVDSLIVTANGANVPLDSSGNAVFVTNGTGPLDIVATATDAAGNSVFQTQSFNVEPDTTPPSVNTFTVTPGTVNLLESATIQVDAVDDVVVSNIHVVVTDPNASTQEFDIDGTLATLSGIFEYIAYVPGTHTVDVTVSDGASNTATAQSTFEGVGTPDTTPPTVSVSVSPATVPVGANTTISVVASDDVLVQSLTLTVNDTPVALDGANQAVYTAPIVGTFNVVATATDPTGNSAQGTTSFDAIDPASDTTNPVVALSDPGSGDTIAGVADITGTVQDLTLQSYTLSWRESGTGGFTTLATGTDPVSNDVLGSIDTTLLPNGLIDLRLQAVDANGNIGQQTIPVIVDGGFKPGVLTLRLLDLEVPVAGTPISIYRTYDSRRRGTSSDFGFGWSVEIVQGASYTNNVQPGVGWNISPTGGFFNFPCGGASEATPHVTEIRLSDVEFYQFRGQILDFTSPLSISGGYCQANFGFIQTGGIPGAQLLIGSGGSTSSAVTLECQIGGDCTTIFGDDAFLPWEPEQVQLRTRDGRVFDVDINTGVTRIADNNDNELLIGSNGVTHRNGDGVVTSSVSFTRVGGRITEVTDPLGNAIQYDYDGAGDLVQVTSRSNRVTRYTYHSGHFLNEIVDVFDPLAIPPEDGETVFAANNYDAEGRLVEQVDADGNNTTFVHDPENGTETITDRNGTVKVLIYDAEGRVTNAQVGALEKTYTYDEFGNILTETDERGNTKTFTYNPDGVANTADDQDVTSEEDALGNVISYGYDPSSGRLNAITANGNTTTFGFDGNGNITQITDGNGELFEGYEYDSIGNPTRVKMPSGSPPATDDTVLTYDASGNRVTNITTAGGLSRSFEYDLVGRVTSETVQRTVGGVTVDETTLYTHDADGRLLTRTDPLGGVTTYTYDHKGRNDSVTDPLGHVARFVYDERDNLVEVIYPDDTPGTDADNPRDIYGYDLEDRRTAHTARNGHTTFFTYDDQGNLTQITYPVLDPSTFEAAKVTFEYDGAGNRTAMVDELGNRTEFAYDDINRLVEERRVQVPGDPGQDLVTSYGFTSDDLKASSLINPRGFETQFAYDRGIFGLVRRTGVTHAAGTPAAATEGMTWSHGPHIGTRTSGNGGVTSFSYDADGRLAGVVDAETGSTSYAYDEVGNLISITDAEGRTTEFTYDALGRRTSRTLPGGQVETMTYDLAGNMIERTDFNGQTLLFTYDELNRVLTESIDDTPDILLRSYSYTASGEVATVADGRGTTTFTYDELDRPLTMSFVPSGGGTAATLAYTYDLHGNRTSVTYTTGPASTATVDYSYDILNRLTTVEAPDGKTTTYTYDANSNVTRIDYPNGTAADMTYDERDLVVQVVHSDGVNVLAQFDYTYDANRNRTQVVESFNNGATGRVVDYTYDGLDRVTREDVTGGTTTDFTYDAASNRISEDDGTTVVQATYDLNDRLTELFVPGIPNTTIATFGYDANGNTISRTDGGGTTTYQYDAFNRLVQVDEPGPQSTSFFYDYRGNRVERTDGGGTTEFVVDDVDLSGYSQVVTELQGGASSREYTHGRDLLRMEQGGAESYFHYDALGSTRTLSDDTGIATDSYDYDAQGRLAFASGATPNNYLFTGEQFEVAGGNYYLRQRYMDPRISRFLTMDRAQPDFMRPITLNRYLYANGNPVNMIDPQGEFSLASVSVSLAIHSVLTTISYFTFIKPVKDFHEKATTLLEEIPGLKLAEGDIEIATWQSAINAVGKHYIDEGEFDITKAVDLGDGAVAKAYEIVEEMVTPFGQVVVQIHKRNAGYWLYHLPKHGVYFQCSFNTHVQKLFVLNVLTAAQAAKRFQTVTNIIGTYMAYFVFIQLAIDTVNDFAHSQEPQPQPTSCPPI